MELESGPLSVIHGSTSSNMWHKKRDVIVYLMQSCEKVLNVKLPSHSPKLQAWVSGFLLAHMPRFLTAIGFLVRIPGPHVLEHDVQFVQIQLSEN